MNGLYLIVTNQLVNYIPRNSITPNKYNKFKN